MLAGMDNTLAIISDAAWTAENKCERPTLSTFSGFVCGGGGILGGLP